MPNDLYVWEAGRATVHHCPQCFKPLTTPQTRSRCLGDHVEWCKAYHEQLFKKGTSSDCDPCKATDEAHFKRHREIAEQIRDLELLKAKDAPPVSPLTPKSLNMVQSHGNFDNRSPLSKHERKEAKKAEKVARLAKAVTTAEIEHIARILRSENYDAEEVDAEQQLLEDEDIQRNLFFHKGTSNRREVRHEFVKKDSRRGSDKTATDVTTVEIDGILQLLSVSPITQKSTTEEKHIVAILRKKIKEDIVQAKNERKEMLMRKAGFWRWASKKAYKRLLENGKLWSDKDHDILKFVKAENPSHDSSSTGALDTETEITEPDTEMADGEGTTATAMAVDSTKKASTPAKTKDTPSPAKSDGWTTVVSKPGKGAKRNKANPNMKLKLVHNGGLLKMVQSPTPKNKHSPGVLGLFDEED